MFRASRPEPFGALKLMPRADRQTDRERRGSRLFFYGLGIKAETRSFGQSHHFRHAAAAADDDELSLAFCGQFPVRSCHVKVHLRHTAIFPREQLKE